MEQAQATRTGQLGVVLFGFWIAARFGLLSDALTRVRIATLDVVGVGSFLHVDLSWLVFAASMLILVRHAPSELAARVCLALLAASQAASHTLVNLERYYSGHALAWDLANFVQPMWRFAHGESMAATWSGGAPLWGDHGSFAFFVFAPFVRIGTDPATALIVLQALITAAAGPAWFVLARRLGLDRASALAVTAALTSSRALANAAGFDFHPECALPLLLALLCLLQRAGKWPWFVVVALLGAGLKDGAAMVVAMTAGWLGLRPLHRGTLLVAMLAGAVACFDVLLLPGLAGWPSYLRMNASAPVDAGVAVQATFGRALSQGGLGWLHPVAWFVGAPWALAAGLSPKLAVKGLSFQYGYLWVPVGALGTLFALRLVSAVRQKALAAGWAILTVAVNAPLSWSGQIGEHAATFSQLRSELALSIKPGDSVATDACSAPLVMDRQELLGLCQLDVDALTQSGVERWTQPAVRAFEADVVLIDRSCGAHGECLSVQLAQVEARGYALERIVQQRWGVFRRASR